MNCPSCFTAGTRLHCTTKGAGEIPLLLIHGFAASSVTWDEIAPYFPEDKYRLYLLDLKGSGQSAKPDDGAYRPTDQASLVLETMEALRISNVSLVGHSLGGGIALLAWHLAKKTGRSQLIARLILIDAAAYSQPLPRCFRLLRRPVTGWLLLKLLPVRPMVRYILGHVYHDPTAVTPERITRYMGCYRGPGTANALISSARQVDDLGTIPDHTRINLPTLIIWGRHDRIVRLRIGKRLHEEIPGSRLVVFDCGHNPHEEVNAKCAQAILDFLEGDDRKRAMPEDTP